MKLVIEESKTAEQLNVLFSNLCGLSDYVTIHKEEEGLHMQGLDSSHVCMFDVKLLFGWFTIYEEDEDDISMITVPAKIFNKVLSTYNKDQNIVIDIDPSGDKLNMEFTSGKTSCDKYFELPLVHLDQELMDIPISNKLEILIDDKLNRFQDIFAAAGHPNAVFKVDLNSLNKITKGKIMDISE